MTDHLAGKPVTETAARPSHIPGLPAPARDLAKGWHELGEVPIDRSTRQYAAQVCWHLLRLLEEAWTVVDDLTNMEDVE